MLDTAILTYECDTRFCAGVTTMWVGTKHLHSSDRTVVRDRMQMLRPYGFVVRQRPIAAPTTVCKALCDSLTEAAKKRPPRHARGPSFLSSYRLCPAASATTS